MGAEANQSPESEAGLVAGADADRSLCRNCQAVAGSVLSEILSAFWLFCTLTKFAKLLLDAAFVYFCENEPRFVRSLPPQIVSSRRVLTTFVKGGQAAGEIRVGSPELLADMLSGALCAVALTWHCTGRRKKLSAQTGAVVQGCWCMIKA